MTIRIVMRFLSYETGHPQGKIVLEVFKNGAGNITFDKEKERVVLKREEALELAAFIQAIYMEESQ